MNTRLRPVAQRALDRLFSTRQRAAGDSHTGARHTRGCMRMCTARSFCPLLSCNERNCTSRNSWPQTLLNRRTRRTHRTRHPEHAHTPTIPPVRDTSATTRARTHSPATGSRTARLARRTGAAGAHAAGTHMPLPGHPTACVSEPESFEKSFEKPLPLHIHSLTNAPRPTRH